MTNSEQIERELDRLDEQLSGCDDPAERQALRDDMRELQRELAEQDRWENEGRDRGWL